MNGYVIVMQSSFDPFPDNPEVYWTVRDYNSALEHFQTKRRRNYTPEELLLVAKAAFRKEDYSYCIEVAEEISAGHSTKVLFQRQSLLFRSLFLSSRHKVPKAELINGLLKVISDFERLKSSAPGPKLEEHHLNRIQEYKDFVVFLEKYGKSQITYNEKMNLEQLDADRTTHKRTGFPCFLVSRLWMDEYDRMRRLTGQMAYLWPLNNYSIINDLFEAHYSTHPLQTHKNSWIFPGTEPLAVSKKLYAFLCSIYSADLQIAPVRRLFQEGGDRDRDLAAPRTVPLIPASVTFRQKTVFYQLTSNEMPAKEIIKLVEERFGIGELTYPKDDEASFQYFYGQDLQTQQRMQRWKTALQYKSKSPELLRQGAFFRHLDPVPLRSGDLDKKRGLRGLVNVGNSCYMNACLQCLNGTKQVVLKLVTTDLAQLLPSNNANLKAGSIAQTSDNKIKDSGAGSTACDGSIVVALGDLLKHLWGEGELAVSPFKFKMYFGKRNPLFSGKTQEDAHQFLLHLLDGVHEDLRGPLGVLRSTSKLDVTTNAQKVKDYFERHHLNDQHSLVYDLFRGIQHTSIKCLGCGTSSHAFDLFLSLSLPVPSPSYPTLKLHLTSPKAYHTRTYEIGCHNLKTLNDLFRVVQEDLLHRREEGREKELKKEPEFSKNDAWRRPGNSNFNEDIRNEVKEEVEVAKKNYLFLGFSKEEDPKQFWNCGFGNSLSSCEISIEEVVKTNMQLVLFELEQPKQEGMALVLVEYKVDSVLGNDRVIGLPRFGYLKEELVKTQEGKTFKKWVTENDPQNNIDEPEIERVKVYQWQGKGSFNYSITVFFRREERLFLDSTFLDGEINPYRPTFPIRDCFIEMGRPQILQDGWKCGHCSSSDGAEKRETLVDTNSILVLTLKRFQANGSKIKHLIDYPLERLDVGEWLEEKTRFGNQLYDLYGVCLHEGTMEYGHYRAYCKHWLTGEWWQFDDERVKPVTQKEIISPHAYMLFYRRREF